VAENDDILAELRSVFRDEVDDHAVNLERAGLTLAREGEGPEARAGAAAEVFRAVHCLKGAARAVGYDSLERFFHAVETRLGSARHGASPDLARVAADAGITLRVLRACSVSLAERGEPDEAALAEARRALQDEAPTQPKAPAQTPTPAPPTPPPPTPSPSVVAVPTLSPDTQRVSSARLAGLFAAAEDLASLVARHGDSSRQLDSLEPMLLELRNDLRRARQQVRAQDDRGDEGVSHALDRTLASMQTLAGWVAERISREDISLRALSGAAGDLLTRSRDLRLVPLATLSALLERAALDVAGALGRRVEFRMDGDLPEVDRRVLDGLREPLLHLVRNAVDHGIEAPEARMERGKAPAGRVRVAATVAGRDVRVAVEDDGRGIDPEAVLAAARERGMDVGLARSPQDAFALLFEPGFSTRASITSLSGRGVGLDVVRMRVAQLHGRVEVESEPGRGTRFVLTVPLDLSVMRGVVVRVRDVRAVIVSTAVVGLRRVADEDLRVIEGHLYLDDEGALVPLASLGETLGFPSLAAAPQVEGARTHCVILAVGERRVAFRVDALLEEREVVVKPLNARVRRAAFVSGAAVFGDGEVVIVLDAADLTRIARPAASVAAGDERRAVRRRVLVVDDSVTTRQLERTILEAAGYDVSVAADGQAAWELLAADERFDAVVSDVEMPRLDGFQLLARIRSTARLAGLPVLLVTALAQAADQQRALDLGASAYVVKSRFDQDELLETLEQLL
jgi:two-component system chemotaxis sensor kinase CheA